MILGIGVDLVDTVRFHKKLEQTPKLLARLFREEEQHFKPSSLAARFAAKEAFVKAMRGSNGFGFQDLMVLGGRDEPPKLVLLGGAKQAAEQLGVRTIHLSLTHDGDLAMAFLILEGENLQGSFDV